MPRNSCGASMTGAMQRLTSQWMWICGDAAASCGAVSGTSVRQHPVFAISPQWPCMALQQEFSERLIVAPFMQARTGVAVASRRRIAAMAEMRRTMIEV